MRAFQPEAAGARPLRRSDSGFTLVELLVVFVIVGALAGIAVPVYLGQKAKAAMATAKVDLHNLAQAEAAFFTDHSRYAPAHELAGTVDFRTSSDGGASVVWSSASEFCVATANQNGGSKPSSALAVVGFPYETVYFDSRMGSASTTPCVAPAGATAMDGGYWDSTGAH